MQVPSLLNYALGRENVYLDMLAGVHDAAQARANAARSGWAGLAGTGLMASALWPRG
ncbi:MAG: hypothetical protein GTO15_06380 [Pseudomonas stutzeri]|nr:hypothetical protein [Stutzerimonas stutzeri]